MLGDAYNAKKIASNNIIIILSGPTDNQGQGSLLWGLYLLSENYKGFEEK